MCREEIFKMFIKQENKNEIYLTPLGTFLGHDESVFSIQKQCKHVCALHDARVQTEHV